MDSQPKFILNLVDFGGEVVKPVDKKIKIKAPLDYGFVRWFFDGKKWKHVVEKTVSEPYLCFSIYNEMYSEPLFSKKSIEEITECLNLDSSSRDHVSPEELDVRGRRVVIDIVQKREFSKSQGWEGCEELQEFMDTIGNTLPRETSKRRDVFARLCKLADW